MLHNLQSSYKKNRSFLNNSIVNIKKLNKSRSVINFALTSSLKAKNSALAKELASFRIELSEVRKENNRLLKENYESKLTGLFRSYQYENYKVKFFDLSDVTITLFNTACKLSENLIELQNHPFVISPKDDYTIPSPFISRDKIQRSPIQNSFALDNNQTRVAIDNLAIKMNRIKDQTFHSIHNLSMKRDINQSLKENIKVDSGHMTVNNRDCLSTQSSDCSKIIRELPSKTAKTSKRKAKKVTINDFTNEQIKPPSDSSVSVISKRKNKSNDPMFGINKTKKKSSRKKLQKLEYKTPNREEYLKKKNLDVFYLSQNETFNTSVLPPTLNEFKGQLKNDAKTKSTNLEKKVEIMIEKINPLALIDDNKEIRSSKQNDDDDFLFPTEKVSQIRLSKQSAQKKTGRKINKKKTSSEENINPCVKKTSETLKPANKINSKKSSESSKPSEIKDKGTENLNDVKINNKEFTNDTNEKLHSARSRRTRTVVNYCLSPITKKKRRDF